MNNLRDFALRSGQAHRLVRNELSADQLKAFKSSLSGDDDGKGSYHYKYSLQDMRQLRMALAKRAGAVRAAGTLPPLFVGRIARGGTGKTTTCANIGAIEAQMGFRVLQIDGDPQASLTALHGIDPNTADDIITIGHMMDRTENGKKPNDEFVRSGIRPVYENGMLDIICSDITLADFDARMAGGTAPERRFMNFLNAHKKVFCEYDLIIVDCAPGSTLLSYNFMFAAKRVFAPVMLEGQSLKAIELLLSNISELNEIDSGGRVIELVANGFHPSYKHCRDSLFTLQSAHGVDPDTGEPMFPGCVLNDNVIPHYAGFGRQVDIHNPAQCQPLVEKEPNCDATVALIDLTLSLNEKYGVSVAHEGMEASVIPELPAEVSEPAAKSKSSGRAATKAVKSAPKREGARHG
jgi:chromosome partitioning protein